MGEKEWWALSEPFSGPNFTSLGLERKLPLIGSCPSTPRIVWQRSQVTPDMLGSVTIARVAVPQAFANATGAWHAVQERASLASSGSRLALGRIISKYCAWKTGLVNDRSWCDWSCWSSVRG